jgi:ParB/RepB/Spo0J family partition protein
MKRFTDTAARIKQDQAISMLNSVKDGTVVPIPLNLVIRTENVRHDRSEKNDPDLEALAASIKEVGLLQHPIVTVAAGQIVCVSGHRRFSACETLKMEKVPCVIRHFDNLTTKQMVQLFENTARRNLHPLDIGIQLQKLKDAGMSQIKLQEIMKKDRKTIGRFQKMATWSEPARKIIYDFPEKLKTGALLQLASRDLSEKDLIKELKHKAGLIKAEAGSEASRKSSTILSAKLSKQLTTETQDYFVKRKIPGKDQVLLLSMLVDLGWIDKATAKKIHTLDQKSTKAKK